MRVQIAARHCDVPETVKTRAEEQASRLTRYDPRLTSAEIVFEEEKHTKRVEGIFSLNRHDPVVVRGEAPEFRPALDQMLDRAGRKLRRQRDQHTDHKGNKPSNAVPPEA